MLNVVRKNAAVKSQIRTASRKTVEAVQAGAVEEAKQALVHATSVIDKAASKGVLHKNTAARKKSNLAAKVKRFIILKASKTVSRISVEAVFYALFI